MSILERTKLKRFIKKLEQYRGRHTEYVSVYIPPGTDLTKIIQHLEQEQGTATNIKDARTRKSVITALERMIRTLKTMPGTPPNGLAIFSGNISDRDNIDDFQVFYIEPPVPINIKLYRCDQRFVLYPLEDLQFDDNAYALIAIDKSEATIGILEGNNIRVLKTLHSAYPGKFKTGGQSAQRFARIREGLAKEFYNRVADVFTQEFTYNDKIKGIIVGGPGTTKNNFVDGNYLNEEFKKKIIAIKDITYTNAYGLQELVDKSQDVLANEEIMEEKKVISEFLEVLSKEPNKVVYGEKRTREALQMSAVEKLILFVDVDEKILEEFSQLAEDTNAEIFLVSDKTPEGQQFKALTGIGGILRYPIH